MRNEVTFLLTSSLDRLRENFDGQVTFRHHVNVCHRLGSVSSQSVWSQVGHLGRRLRRRGRRARADALGWIREISVKKYNNGNERVGQRA